ncbi:MAG: porin [Moraxellaceae bacterium]|nr:porin [Moraxellaceae bacterium]
MLMFRQLGAVVALGTLCGVAGAENITPNLKFNGFASATVAVVDDPQGGAYIDDIFGYGGVTKDPEFGLESLIGLQFDYRVSDKTNLVAQLVAEGRNYYDVRAEWAYIAHELNDSLRVRAGRFALPTFMYSDTIKVGQSYPWVRTPVEAYAGVPVTNFDGVDLLYRKPLGDWNFNAQVLVGGSTTELFRTRNAHGFNLSLSSENLTIRGGMIASDLTFPVTCSPIVPCPLDVKDEKNVFSNLGAVYDDGTWFVAGELAQLEINGWLNDWNAGYVSVGHYVGKWLPYLLAAKINTYNGDECVAVAFGLCPIATQYNEQTTYAIGARYAISSNLSLKAQVDHVHDFNGSEGFLAGGPTPPDSFNVFTVSLTTSF